MKVNNRLPRIPQARVGPQPQEAIRDWSARMKTGEKRDIKFFSMTDANNRIDSDNPIMPRLRSESSADVGREILTLKKLLHSINVSYQRTFDESFYVVSATIPLKPVSLDLTVSKEYLNQPLILLDTTFKKSTSGAKGNVSGEVVQMTPDILSQCTDYLTDAIKKAHFDYFVGVQIGGLQDE